mmetsp:Transcript_44176/g.103157  ORF Transcript_44176/g.103157 Transcript_44176/m.103157 type:complete len:314 (+) Transcript_44176:569-1510(+)
MPYEDVFQCNNNIHHCHHHDVSSGRDVHNGESHYHQNTGNGPCRRTFVSHGTQLPCTANHRRQAQLGGRHCGDSSGPGRSGPGCGVVQRRSSVVSQAVANGSSRAPILSSGRGRTCRHRRRGEPSSAGDAADDDPKTSGFIGRADVHCASGGVDFGAHYGESRRNNHGYQKHTNKHSHHADNNADVTNFNHKIYQSDHSHIEFDQHHKLHHNFNDVQYHRHKHQHQQCIHHYEQYSDVHDRNGDEQYWHFRRHVQHHRHSDVHECQHHKPDIDKEHHFNNNVYSHRNSNEHDSNNNRHIDHGVNCHSKHCHKY